MTGDDAIAQAEKVSALISAKEAIIVELSGMTEGEQLDYLRRQVVTRCQGEQALAEGLDRIRKLAIAHEAVREDHRQRKVRVPIELDDEHKRSVEDLRRIVKAIRADIERATLRENLVVVVRYQKRANMSDAAWASEQAAVREALKPMAIALARAGSDLQPLTADKAGVRRGEVPRADGKAGTEYGLIATCDVLRRLQSEGKLEVADVLAAQRWGRLADRVYAPIHMAKSRFTDAPSGEWGGGADPVDIRDAYDRANGVLTRNEIAVLTAVVRHAEGLAVAGEKVAHAAKGRDKRSGMAEAWLISGSQRLRLHFGI
jgi:hypothetical protein